MADGRFLARMGTPLDREFTAYEYLTDWMREGLRIEREFLDLRLAVPAPLARLTQAPWPVVTETENGCKAET